MEVTNEIQWTYDEDNRLVDELFATDADTLLDAPTDLGDNRPWTDYEDHYTYDLAGNRLEKTTDLGTDGTVDESTASEYDENDRLETETTGDKITTYGYDHTQQTSKMVTDGTETLSSTQYSFDVNGRLAVATVTTYASGSASNIQRMTYGYDETGTRVSALAETDAEANGTYETRVLTEFLTDNVNMTGYSQVLRETTIDPTTGNILKTVDYALGLDQISQTTTEYVDAEPGTQTTAYFGTDGHGSVRILFDLAGAIMQFAGTYQIYNFDAYGNALRFNPANAATSYLYSGEKFDAWVDMQYLRNRWYTPTSGRFVSLDSFRGNMQNPLSLNKYQYTHADPINGVDPSGKMLAQVLAGISIGTGVIAGGFYAALTGRNIFLGMIAGGSAAVLAAAGVALAFPTVASFAGLFGGGFAGWLITGIAAFDLAAFIGALQVLAVRETLQEQNGPGPTKSKAEHDYDYALLSLDVYDGDAYGTAAQLAAKGWAKVPNKTFRNDAYGYYAELWENQGRNEAVMVYRGTDFYTFADWFNNVVICPQKLFQRYEGRGWVKGCAGCCWSAGAG